MKFIACIVFPLFCFAVVPGYSFNRLYCFKCVSTQPGCGSPFVWSWHWSQRCPEENDRCIKLIERKGGNEVITRDCLSSLTFRTDIPADHYEGCRPAVQDPRLAHYVNNSIKEYDIKRDYYDYTEWCFCYFDDRCNGSSNKRISFIALGILLLAALLSL